MASTRPNPFGSATPLGEGLSNVFGAFMAAPTPEDRAKSALQIYGLQAQGQRDLAAAGYDTSRTAGQDIQNKANAALPTLDFNSPEALGTVMQAGGAQGYGNLADVFATHQALQPGATPESMDPIVFAKTGNAGNTFAGFNADQQRQRDKAALEANTQRYGYDTQAATSRANNDADNARALVERKLIEGGLDARNAATLANNIVLEQIKQAGENGRATVNAGAGDTVFTSPTGPFNGQTFKGNSTPQTVQGNIAQKFIDDGGNVNQPLNPQTPLGAAFDTKNPSDGGLSLTVGKDGSVQMTQGGAGQTVPSSVVGDNLAAQDAIQTYLRTSKELRTVAASDPTLFGTVGNVRRLFQATASQADLALQMFGKSNPGAAKDADTVFETVLADLASAGVTDPTIYDPNLTDIDKMAILAAYQAAGAIAGQEGRGLSNEDFQKFRTIVGDPTAWGSNQQSFLAGLNRLDGMAVGELNARRQRLGQPPIDPNGAPAPTDQQGSETKTINGKQYMKVNGQWFEVLP